MIINSNLQKHPFVRWTFSQHERCNNQYDKLLPYQFHLKMVLEVYDQFKHLLPEEGQDATDVYLACVGHDLLEETNLSYNDVKRNSNINIAEMIFAVTDAKGRNRPERANDKHYEALRACKYADFVKLCDRIANVIYGRYIGRQKGMYRRYQEEQANFIEKLGYSQNHPYIEMFHFLNGLLSPKEGDIL